MMGRAYENGGTAASVKKWYDAARKWYKQAESDHPQDLLIKRNLTQFLVRTNHLGDAESYLDTMMQGGNAEAVAWATRVRALVYVRSESQLSKALALFEPNGKPAAAGQEGKTRKDPDDLRVIALTTRSGKNPCSS